MAGRQRRARPRPAVTEPASRLRRAPGCLLGRATGRRARCTTLSSNAGGIWTSFDDRADVHARARVCGPAHGVGLVTAPWTQAGSGVTLPFETLLAELAVHQPVTAVKRRTGEHDTRIRQSAGGGRRRAGPRRTGRLPGHQRRRRRDCGAGSPTAGWPPGGRERMPPTVRASSIPIRGGRGRTVDGRGLVDTLEVIQAGA